MDSAELV